MDLVRSGAGVRAILAASDWLADRDRRGKEPPRRSSRRIQPGLRNLCWARLAVLLVVAVNLKDDRLALHVLDKRSGEDF